MSDGNKKTVKCVNTFTVCLGMFAHPLVLIVNLQIYEKKQDEFCFSPIFLSGRIQIFHVAVGG